MTARHLKLGAILEGVGTDHAEWRDPHAGRYADRAGDIDSASLKAF